MKDILEFIIDLRGRGVFIQEFNEQLKITGNVSSLSEEDKNTIRELKPALLNFLKDNGKGRKQHFSRIEPVAAAKDYSLSSSQRRLWILSQYDQGNAAYNISGAYVFEGSLDTDVFRQSFDVLIARHEILRTVFREDEEGRVRQLILSPEQTGFDISFEDLRLQDEQVRQQLVAEIAGQLFDLAAGPLVRAGLYQVADNKWVFAYAMHHIISDAWSMDVLIRELLQVYNARAKGEPESLQPLRIQYKDYAAWQQEQLSGDALRQHQEYWLKQFDGELPVLELIPDRPRPAVKTYNGASVRRKIDIQLTRSLKALTQELGSTLFMGLLAAVKALIYRYTGQEDVVIGSPIAGRDHVDLEGQIGFYINTLALRTRFKGESSYRELLEQVKQTTLNAYEYQLYPFDEIVEKLGLRRDTSRSPLFDVMVILQNAGSEHTKAQQLDKLAITGYEGLKQMVSQFDITFEFGEAEDGLQLNIVYNSDLYDVATIERMGNHLEELLRAATANAGCPVQELDFINAAEKEQLLLTFNDTAHDYPSDKTLVALFEEQVSRTPEQVALVFNGTSFTYRELNERANQLGAYLREQYNICPDDLVGVQLQRSEQMIIALLGVLKSGGAYVPVDPGYPQERIDYILEDSGCKVMLDAAAMERFAATADNYSREDLPLVNQPTDLVYVIYTSGSTGRPKGCMLEHRGVINRIEWMWSHYGFHSDDIILQKTTFTFDVSVWELWMPLCWGTRMVLCEQDDIGSPDRIVALINREGITCLHFVPSMLQAFLSSMEDRSDLAEQLQSLRRVFTSGEALSTETVNRWYERVDVPVHNLYGPTEASVDVTYYATQRGDRRIPIGRPIWNTSMYVLGSRDQLAPVGVVGELCIGGTGLARGYLNKPELTAEKFVADPFRAGERIYRTGDLGRWLADGNIEYLGRKDDQVKIRGYRIELGEISVALESHDMIRAAVTVVRTNPAGDKELMAYFTGDPGVEVSELRSWLGRCLPSYMLPHHYIRLHAIPLTSNGKVDRKQLPVPEELALAASTSYVAPRNEKERCLVAMYEEVLKKQPIGIKDDFFALGGDSIKSIQVVSRLRQRGYALTIGDILQYPVVEDLVGHMSVISRTISQATVEGIIPLSPIQKHFFETRTTDRHHYNQSVLLYSRTPVSEDGLRAALDKIMAHHDALRMVFRETPEGLVQENKGLEAGCTLEVINATDKESFNAHCDRIQSGIDLATGPLFKAVLFHGADGDRILLVAHHLVIDGVSWRIIFEDLSSLYQQYISGTPLTLPAKTDSFAYWQEQQLAYAGSDALQQEEPYWNSIASTPVQSLPLDNPDGSNLLKDVGAASFMLDEATTEKLLTGCYKAYRTDVNDILLTAMGLALEETFGLKQAVISLEGHGREDIGSDTDVTRTVGWFASLYPVVLNMQYKDDMIRQLIAVKENLHRLPNKGIGYGILHYLAGRDYKIAPEIIFNYLGDFGSGVKTDEGDALFAFSSEFRGKEYSGNIRRHCILNISGMIADGRFRLRTEYSTGQYTASTINQLLTVYQRHLEQLVERLSREEEVHLTPVDLTYRSLNVEQVLELDTRYRIEDVYPLSPLQEGLYYHWSASPDSPVYFEEMSYQLKGSLDLALLEESYNRLVARHAILRTFFTPDYGEELLQVVRREVPSTFRVLDITGDDSFSIEAYKQQNRSAGFDLHKGPMIRLAILHNADTYEFIWSHHHILMDGWCRSILVKEFFQIYHALQAGRTPELNKVYAYSDYIKWLNGIDKAKTLDYWTKYLQGYDTVSSLPQENSPVAAGYRAGQNIFILDGDIRRSIRTLCAEMGITENTFIQAVWGILLSKYNNTDDVVFGTVVSARPPELEGVEEMIGLFSNAIPVRIPVEENVPVRELLKDVQQRSIEGIDHHYMQLAEIQSLTAPGRNLFDHILLFENYPVQEMVKQSVESTEENNSFSLLSTSGFERSSYDFMFTVMPAERFLVKFSYNANLYSEAQVTALYGHLVRIIENILKDQSVTVGETDCLTPQERHQLLTSFNASAVEYPQHNTLLGLFEDQVKKTPDNTAVFFEGASLTYRKLDEKANQLANYLLQEYQLQKDELVAIMLDRSEKMLIAILGTLKAGAAYVPIDPGYPETRKEFILKDTGAKALITQTDYVFDLDYYEGAVFAIDIQLDSIEAPAVTTGVVVQPGDLAYVIYTSGSTGNPKGVMIEHRAIVNTIYAQQTLFNVQQHERGLQFASLSFDASVWEIFLMLSSGGALYIVSEEAKKTPQLLEQYIAENEIDIATLPPAYVKVLSMEGISRIRQLITAGEAAIADQAVAFTKYGTYYNAYGPTESSICATIFRLNGKEMDAEKGIPVGIPIPNTQIYIVNNHGNLLPAGVAGEICIAGAGLARGYLNNRELTALKFVPNPFREDERMYRTGDLGKWLPDGNIAFIGRKDNQVKIRGYRIEPGEIESALQAFNGISAVAVVPYTNAAGEKELVAYLSGNDTLSAADIRAYLEQQLPSYMIPAHYVLLEALPLNTSGKIDRKNLPAPEGLGMLSGVAYVPPVTETEQRLVAIWQEVLGKERIGIKDDFFDLGGHSLKATRLASQIHKEFDVKITLKDLFASTILEEQAAFIEKERKTSFTEIPAAPVQPHYPLSASQRRLWILSQFEEASVAYNMSGAYMFEGELHLESLEHAFNMLLIRHEGLRTIFREDSIAGVRQFILLPEETDARLVYQDLRGEQEQDKKLRQLIFQVTGRPFNLAAGPLLRAGVYRVADDKWIFAYGMHHIISDGWSLNVLINELLALYHAHTAGALDPLAPLRIQYKDYAVWQQEQLSGASLEEHRQYWLQQFAGELPVLELFPDNPRPAVKTYNGGVVHKALSKELTGGLRALVQEEGATLFMGLLAAVKALLYRYTGQEDIIVGSPVAGREHIDLEDQIGFYVNTLALRTRFQGTDSYRELLSQIRDVTLGAYEHQVYPFDDLVDELGLQRNMSRSALFDVMVILQNNTRRTVAGQRSDSLRISTYKENELPVSKFDLAFDFVESGEEIQARISYNSDIYSRNTIARLAGHLEGLIRSLVKQPAAPIHQLDYLSEVERQQLLVTFNRTGASYPGNKTLTDLFEDQVERTPHLPAVVYDGITLTYSELNEKANQLAAYLRDHYRVMPDNLVAIKLDRSEWLIIAILGVLKSGAAYLPVDPAYPQERIDYILQDSNCCLLIDEGELAKFRREEEQYSTANLSPAGTTGNLAYVIYTSGSTGRPKGVMIEHGTIVNTILSQREIFDIRKGERGLQFASASFDASVSEIFIIITAGGTLYIISDEAKKAPLLLEKCIIENEIDIATIPPAYLKLLKTERIRGLRKLITAGEQAVYEQVADFTENGICFNAYGPTESSICATIFRIDKGEAPDAHNIPIGTPIANTSIYILDSHSNLVPIGAVGELCIGGAGLARAYLNKPELTAEKFVPDPFRAGARIYKTGDLARWLPDGNIEFVGRKDEQVKIRGFRIETGEIGNVLQQHPEVEAAVVTVRVNADGEKELIAYLVGRQSLNALDMRSHLSRTLPVYMLPDHYLQLEELPLNASGKVDKKRLPSPEGLELSTGVEYVAPRNEIEEKLVQIWQELLGREKIGIIDNFFEVGGTSMKIVKLSKLASVALDREISVALLFQYANIRDLADYLTQKPVSYVEVDFDRDEVIGDLDKFKFN
ncbi:non-ribosomal peptide synthetase [Chitinophaga tropicalis]|uniref:Amino acid adenylation domain-containing protein n=1 Tax=Chitinophaga tropicalis TaxID=2683588 RepID=A0A7K1UAW3_9BACT|nr:non-ribosomal peptide synthetase [Chitinophaga tropicalis]MVT11418.1 amino acid adenylation domain-containing protein [Chitinophaga tropicalis]